MTFAQWLLLGGTNALVFGVSCFSCYMIGYYAGEKQAGRLFHEMQVINSPSRAYAQTSK